MRFAGTRDPRTDQISAPSKNTSHPPAAPSRKPQVRITASGHKFVTHPSVGSAAGALKPTASREKQRAAAAPAGRFPKHATTFPGAKRPPEPVLSPKSKQLPGTRLCRKCAQVHPLTDFFVDKRIEDGFMHYCAPCARKNGLSGRFATPAELAAGQPNTASVSTRTATVQCHPNIANERGVTRPTQPNGPSKAAAGFYAQGLSPYRPPWALPAMKAGERIPKRSRAPDLDWYEDDFVDNALQDQEEDWRKELKSVRFSCRGPSDLSRRLCKTPGFTDWHSFTNMAPIEIRTGIQLQAFQWCKAHQTHLLTLCV
jgi:hypothetical protein